MSDQRNCFFRFACSLLRQGMKQIIVKLETPDIKALERAGDKDAITKVNLDLELTYLYINEPFGKLIIILNS